jgi:hypothetical protein
MAPSSGALSCGCAPTLMVSRRATRSEGLALAPNLPWLLGIVLLNAPILLSRATKLIGVGSLVLLWNLFG